MASNLYQSGLVRLVNGTDDYLTDTIKVMLLGTGYTPNKDHDFISDVSGSELSGTGYTGGFGGAGRKTLASKTIAADDTNDRAKFDAADVTWSAINAGTIGYVVVCKEVTSDADSPIYACIDVADVVTDGNDFTLNFDAAGIFAWGA